MNSRKVTVVDYGIGNLLSVGRALESSGAQVVFSDRAEVILASDRVVLPGVGAFAKGMHGLRERNLVDPLIEFAAKGRPLLGICLGMQMLFRTSTEFGEQQGLGLIEGRIVAIEPRDAQGLPMKVPHIGWSPLTAPPGSGGWKGSVLQRVAPGAHVYFVHSFTAQPERQEDRLADTFYGSARVSAAVRKGNISGCQFHPEKSAATGLSIITSFLEI